MANLQNRDKYHSYVSPQLNGTVPQHGIVLAYQNTRNCLTSGRTTGITLYVLRIIRILQHFKDLHIFKSNLRFIDLCLKCMSAPDFSVEVHGNVSYKCLSITFFIIVIVYINPCTRWTSNHISMIIRT